MSWVLLVQIILTNIIALAGILVFSRMCFFYKNNRDPLNSVKPWVYELIEKDVDRKYIDDNG